MLLPFVPTAGIPPRPEGGTRIVAFSDWRVQNHDELAKALDEIGGASIIVYAGDDLDRFWAEGWNHFRRLAQHSWAGRVLAVAGNDDEPEAALTMLEDHNAWNLQLAPYVERDVAFLGNEGSTRGPALLKHTEEYVAKHLAGQWLHIKKVKRVRTRVLVTHTPPHGVLDIGRRFGVEHIGSTAVREFVDNTAPDLVICGHCHGFGGITEMLPNGTLVVNIASHDDPGADARLAIIDIDRDGKINVHCTTTREILHKHELLSLIQVGPSRLNHFLKLGISSLAHITERNRDKLRCAPRVGDWHVDRWLKQAAILRGERQGLYVLDRSKLAFLNDDQHIIWDIETNIGQDTVWLIGAKDTRIGEVAQFFDPDDEHKVLREFCAWVAKLPNHHLVSYSGSRFESRTMEIVLRRHKMTRHLPRFTEDHDIGHHIQYDCVGPYRQFELKRLAPAMGFRRFRHPHLTGLHVGMVFTKYALSKTAPPSWTPYLEYNEDDVLATEHVFGTLRQSTHTADEA